MTTVFSGDTGNGTDLPSGDTTAIQLDDGNLVVLAFKDPQHVAAPYGGGDVLGKGLIRFLDPNTGAATKADIILGSGKTIVNGIEKTPDNGFIVYGQAKESLYGKQFGGATDAFVIKYKSDGTFQWIQSFNTSLHESIGSASVEPSGKILVSGRTSYDLSEPRVFGGQSWYGQALGGRYYAAFTSSISAQGSVDWVNVYGGLSGGIGIAADKNGYVSSIYTGVNSTPTNYSYFDYSNNLKWSKDVNVNDYAAAMDVFYGQGIISIVSGSNQVSLVNESGALLKTISAPNGGTVHDIEVRGDKLFLLSRSGASSNLEVSVYDKSGLQQGVSTSIPGSAEFVDKYYFEYDLEILADGKYLISGNTGDAGFAGAIIGDYREYILFDPNPKPIVRGNSLYTIVDGPSWTQAEANSVKLGGHLVTINDAQEDNWIYSELASKQALATWIGASDAVNEGNWLWSDGSKWSYTNWSPGEPSNSNQENYAQYVPAWTNGKWNDHFNQESTGIHKSDKGIAETPFIRRGDSAYVIVSGPTWEEAEANAVKLGGHLVTINDISENNWLFENAIKGISDGVWLGATDKEQEGVWKWADGTPWVFTNWNQNQPSITSEFDPLGEDYLQFVPGHSGYSNKWNDITHKYITFPHKTSIGIAEIKLAPNNTPTGTPTVAGTFKVGSTLTIDATAIKDSDNFTGYTPTFKYNWETSTDGTTWSKLTTTDATDNNSTYTLTTAEVGKQVRGVVSYLDGYGTNESVASAGSANVIAPSNTAPTAVQTLTGSSKVGRVLTVDKSTIVDPDGVPSGVSYGWEVSTNGTTWTKLTSADATDNNSTYALTAAELGKTVRSVISYTDGFGTNEMVSSAPTSVVLAGAKPTGISLSKSTFAENVGPNTAVAKLSSVDLDTDDAYTYTLVTGPGSTDNSRFSIAGDQLVITGNPDFETKNSYSIRLRTTDLGGLWFEKSFPLKVINVNEAPIAISLSDTIFDENIAAGSVIGNLSSLDPDKETSFTYSLTPNSPRATFADNQFFSIVNDQLMINASANFEQKDSYSISVRSTDAGKLFYDQVFTLVVQDIDEAPTDISITGTGIDEGAAVGSIVGSLVSTDQDESSTDFAYELVAGNKPNNNDQFEIVGDQLKAKSTFNFETKSLYVVNVRTTDDSGLTFTKSIIIKVNNVNENPTDLTVSANTFNENLAIGTTVSTLGVLDPDKGDTYSYSFVSGEGDKDNQAFLIAGNALKVNVATNFEVQKSYAVRLRVTDQGGLFFDKAVMLGVNNQIEKVSSGVSTTLAPDKDTLELTGTRNVFGMGNQFDNTITGNSGRNKLVGGMGKDTLTGGTGIDTFFYNDLKESLLPGFDVITDFAAGERIIAGFLFEGDDLIASTGKASALTGSAIGSVLSNTIFLANNAAAFTVEGHRGTFLALNDGRDGFQEESDALIHLSNYTIGSKTPISII